VTISQKGDSRGYLHTNVSLAKTGTAQREQLGFTLPVRATPAELHDGQGSAADYTLFLHGDVSRRPPLSYYVKKHAAVNDCPDLLLFQTFDTHGKDLDRLLQELSLVQGAAIAPPEDGAQIRLGPSSLQVKRVVALLAGTHKGASTMKLRDATISLAHTNYPEDGGKSAQVVQWRFDEPARQLFARAEGTDPWTMIKDEDFVHEVTEYCAEVTVEERTAARNAAPTERNLKPVTVSKLRRLVAGPIEGQSSYRYFTETVNLKKAGVRDKTRGGWYWHLHMAARELRVRKGASRIWHVVPNCQMIRDMLEDRDRGPW
jgi:hypothetical protein